MSNNQPETVKFLYEKGFSVDLIDVRGNTALDIAKENGLDEIVSIFPKGGDDLVEEILMQQKHLTFEQNFAHLQKNEMWVQSDIRKIMWLSVEFSAHYFLKMCVTFCYQ